MNVHVVVTIVDIAIGDQVWLLEVLLLDGDWLMLVEQRRGRGEVPSSARSVRTTVSNVVLVILRHRVDAIHAHIHIHAHIVIDIVGVNGIRGGGGRYGKGAQSGGLTR